jgi:hypothetical protein
MVNCPANVHESRKYSELVLTSFSAINYAIADLKSELTAFDYSLCPCSVCCC